MIEKPGSAIALDAMTHHLFQGALRLPQVLAELIGTEGEDLAVPLAVATDLVSRCRDAAHQLGTALGDPAHDEEGALRVVPIEQVQQDAGIGLDPAWQRSPARPAGRTDAKARAWKYSSTSTEKMWLAVRGSDGAGSDVDERAFGTRRLEAPKGSATRLSQSTTPATGPLVIE